MSDDSRNGNGILVDVQDLKMHFPVMRGLLRRQVGAVKAVDGVSFQVRRGETLGLVGESGCGKSTVALALIQMYRPTSGHVYFEGTDLTQIGKKELRPMRRHLQMVFQDPYASLNPRLTVEKIIGEPIIVHKLASGKEMRERVRELLSLVGLDPRVITRYPHEFSGGQRQRIGVARALAADPTFVVCDEPISALDVSIQAQIINLLEALQDRFNLTYLVIAHDLAVIRHISNRIAVMYLGKIMELADRDELYENPLNPYTQALLSAVPIPDPPLERQRRRTILTGDVPSPLHPPTGCNFNTRCPLVKTICRREDPPLRDFDGHQVACHLVE
jgi:oligopeptide transport system ATP-binding protein